MPRRRIEPFAGRRDPFAPLLESPLAAMLRDADGPGAATAAVPTGGAPLPVTRYADGCERINLGTGNYLGLAGDPRVVAAASEALRQYGTSTSGSRVLNGTTRLHLALEEELADFYGTEATVLTSSGVNANVALLSTVCAPQDVLLVDAQVHASLHAAAAASRGTPIRFRHNDLDHLAQRLGRAEQRAVVVDGRPARPRRPPAHAHGHAHPAAAARGRRDHRRGGALGPGGPLRPGRRTGRGRRLSRRAG